MNSYNNVEEAVDAVIKSLDKKIVMGIPLGIGKPSQFVNALYARAKKDTDISLRIITALSLERPKPAPGLESRFLEPVFERLFDGYVELDYIQDLKKQDIPDNIVVSEFFFKSGSMLGNNYAQQHYISSNYTHVARDMIDLGANLIAQQVSKGTYNGQQYFSLGSNPDVTVDLMPLIKKERAQGRKIEVVAQINQKMPFMLNDALVEGDAFDHVIDNEDLYTKLFSPPSMPVTPVDFAIGMHASSLIKDGGTLQIGIGSLGDAIVYACMLRDQKNTTYKKILHEIGGGQHSILERVGGLESFDVGLYGSSEMFVNGFLHLINEGILKRKVYEDVHIQRLVNQGRLGETLGPESLDDLIAEGFFSDLYHREEVEKAKHFGIFNERIDFSDGQLTLDGSPIGDRTDDPALLGQLKSHGMGERLKRGIVMHGGFFLGPQDFYEALLAMPVEERERICMTGVGHVNQLLINGALVTEQRKHARFINTGLMATLNGAVVSDGLDNGNVVSGVGGQYNFVTMAHALPDARSILLIRSTRESRGEASSNIVWSYGHVTIPRHLRDIVVTEYGIADLRGKSDSEVIMAMLNVADSRFQEQLRSEAVENGKLPEGYRVPEQYCNNFPERIDSEMAHYRSQGLFPAFPLGTDFTEQELQIGACLKHLKTLQSDKLQLFKTLFKAFTEADHEAQAQSFLERMDLIEPQTRKEKLEKKLLIHELVEAGLIS